MSEDKQRYWVARWLLMGVCLLIVQIMLGGITRLMGAGLSITEWQPIMGVIPPLYQQAWIKAFEQYKQIAQYKYINSYFTLRDFKWIFFWEWFHRCWARLMGICFLLPFLFFLIKGFLKKWMVPYLVILFLLGFLQGVLGWVMVKSGLNNEDVFVSPLRLAIHFIAGIILVGYTFIFYLRVKMYTFSCYTVTSTYIYILFVLSFLVCVQLFFGALMAGSHAALVAPTWPTINGQFWNNGLDHTPFYANTLLIQSIHRTIAYIILILTWLWYYVAVYKTTIIQKKILQLPIYMVCIQVILGITSLITSKYMVKDSFSTFEWFALIHQFIGMVFFLTIIGISYVSAVSVAKK